MARWTGAGDNGDLRCTLLRTLDHSIERGTARLITLSGLAGVGKTVLADALLTDVARSTRPHVLDEAVWVDAALLDGAVALLPAIATAAGVQADEPGAVAARLDRRSRVVVVDAIDRLGPGRRLIVGDSP